MGKCGGSCDSDETCDEIFALKKRVRVLEEAKTHGKEYDDTKMQQRIVPKFELYGYQPYTKQSNQDGSPPKNP